MRGRNDGLRCTLPADATIVDVLSIAWSSAIRKLTLYLFVWTPAPVVCSISSQNNGPLLQRHHSNHSGLVLRRRIRPDHR